MKSPHRKVMLHTLGCKINQYDTNFMVSCLRREGHEVVTGSSEADVVVINTCTVTGRTDYKGRQLVRKAIHQKRGEGPLTGTVAPLSLHFITLIALCCPLGKRAPLRAGKAFQGKSRKESIVLSY